MPVWLHFGIGLALSALIGWAAYRRGALSRSGVVGAIVVGTTIFGCGGWEWGVLLITFFVLSSLMSAYRARAKEGLAEKFAKGSRRDLGQTLANGGVGVLAAVAYALHPHPGLWAAFVGAMASVNADTWATELGVLSARPPRLLTTWRQVEPGTSGGISTLGSAAALLGALAIGLAAAAFTAANLLLVQRSTGATPASSWSNVAPLLPAAIVGGLVGSLCDSLLGATVQAIYYSPSRGKETEKRIDPDGSPNLLRRGWRWLDNDAVNLLSSLVGAAAGAALWSLL